MDTKHIKKKIKKHIKTYWTFTERGIIALTIAFIYLFTIQGTIFTEKHDNIAIIIEGIITIIAYLIAYIMAYYILDKINIGNDTKQRTKL